jgi:hypothetical protein
MLRSGNRGIGDASRIATEAADLVRRAVQAQRGRDIDREGYESGWDDQLLALRKEYEELNETIRKADELLKRDKRR